MDLKPLSEHNHETLLIGPSLIVLHMNQNPVSIVIPNFNGAAILEVNLPKVIKACHDYDGKCEIIVVDDASSDHSVEMLQHSFSQVKLIRHNENQGFADTVHTGISAASHEIIILLNSDVWPHTDFISPLVKTLLNCSNVFAVTPLVYDPEGRPQNFSWNRYTFVRGTFKSTAWKLEDALLRREREGPLKSLYASGGSMAVRKDRFLNLGGFLPIYKPFYSEDMDLCTRAWMHGWQTLFEPRSKVVHDHIGTIKRFFRSKKIRITRIRNRNYYTWLYCSWRRLILSHIPWSILRLFLRLLRLDVTFPVALFKSLANIRSVISLRSQIKRAQPFKTLDQLIIEIESSCTK
jgi:GT2 family glycosyltransferase